MRTWLRASLLAGLSACSHQPPVPVNQCIVPPKPMPAQCVTRAEVINVVSSLADENDEEAAKLNELESALRGMRNQLASALSKSLESSPRGSTQVTVIGAKVRVRLSNELLFPSGSAKLGDAGLHALDQVAAVLRGVPSHRIEIAGHTDDTPVLRTGANGFEDNWQLSSERARQVALHLIEKGLPGNRLYIGGYADTDPVEVGATDEARAHNRRVELFIEPTSTTTTAKK